MGKEEDIRKKVAASMKLDADKEVHKKYPSLRDATLEQMTEKLTEKLFEKYKEESVQKLSNSTKGMPSAEKKSVEYQAQSAAKVKAKKDALVQAQMQMKLKVGP